MTPTIWTGAYDDNWRELIVPEAFAHPAKMARGLVVRIFDYLLTTGALHKGETVLDPFGGIGTTAVEGASRGVRVVCCELEPRFVALARQNVALHRRDWEAMGRPLPVIVEGDSRYLREVLAAADAIVSSPPYAVIASGAGGLNTQPPKHAGQQGGRSASSASQDTDQRYGSTDGQLARFPKGEVDAVISSPPYEGSLNATTKGGIDFSKTSDGRDHGRFRSEAATNSNGMRVEAYGETPGQIGALSGDGGVEAVVSSPPYWQDRTHSENPDDIDPAVREKLSKADLADRRYGDTEGQLGEMPSGEVDAVVSSPPFTQGYSGGGGINVKGYEPGGVKVNYGCAPDKVGERTYQGRGAEREPGNLETLTLGEVAAVVTSPPYEANTDRVVPHGGHVTDGDGGFRGYYSENPANLGNPQGASGETFWQAAQQVVRECYALLKPGGYAVWVVKAFVRNKKLVDFPGDWRRLCEHAGFETVEEIHASLVQEDTVPGLFEDRVVKRERKSFFRRLAEKKGSPKIDWEVVWIMQKPC